MSKLIIYYEDKAINIKFCETSIQVEKLLKELSNILGLLKEQEENLFLHNSLGGVLSRNEIINSSSKNNTYILKIYNIPYPKSPKKEDLYKLIQIATNASLPIIKNISSKSQSESKSNPLLLIGNSFDDSDWDNDINNDFDFYPLSSNNSIMNINSQLVFFIYVRTLLNGRNIFDSYGDDDYD